MHSAGSVLVDCNKNHFTYGLSLIYSMTCANTRCTRTNRVLVATEDRNQQPTLDTTTTSASSSEVLSRIDNVFYYIFAFIKLTSVLTAVVSL